MSLLSEHEVTRLITLVWAMAEKMGIEAAGDPALPNLSQDVAPERGLLCLMTGVLCPGNSA